MNLHPSALPLFLGASGGAASLCADAFVPAPPSRPPSLSSRSRTADRRTSASSGGSGRRTSRLAENRDRSLISSLAFYPSDESLSERLKHVQSEWENVSKQGLGKFLADELEAAEKIVRGNAETAEKGAEDVMKQGEDDYLLKQGFHGMVEAGERLAGEVREVRQEFDELRAAKAVEGAAEDVANADVMMEKDLEKVVEGVVSSLQEAKEVVLSAIGAVESKEGITDAARSELKDRLEAKARNIEESIKVADSVAKTAKDIAIEDQKVMTELEKTGDRLSDAIEAAESTTAELRGAEGGSAVDAVSETVDRAAAIVRDDLLAAESVADAINKKVAMEADAVLSLDAAAADSARAARAAGSSLASSGDGEGSADDLASALEEDARDIGLDTDVAGRLAKAMVEDAADDEAALDALERSSKEVDELIDAVDGAVGRAEGAVEAGASSASAKIVAEVVEDVEEKVDDAKESIEEAEEAAEKCEECRAKEVEEEIEASEEGAIAQKKEEEESATSEEEGEESETSDKEEEASEAEAEKSEVTDNETEKEEADDEEEEADESSDSESKDESDSDSDSNNDGESDSDSNEEENEAEENVDEPVLESKAEDDPTNLMSSSEEKEELLAQSEPVPAENEPSEAIITASSENDATPIPEEVVAVTDNGGADPVEALADAAASTETPEGVGDLLASVASDVSESLSSSSETVHDAVVSSTETLAEAVAVISSLFL